MRCDTLISVKVFSEADLMKHYDEKQMQENILYLEALSEQYPNIQSAAAEMINLHAILDLPKGTEHFLSDIHGEHFRVTNEQWNFLMSNLNIEGVPTYFIIDSEGNITYKKTGFPGVETMKKQLLKTLSK